MIIDTLQTKIAEAMKLGDTLKVSTLRMLLSAMNYEKIAKQHALSEEEEIAVVRREAKKRKDAIEAYTKAGAKDRVDQETQESDILKTFLPAEISEEELRVIVSDAISQSGATEVKDMGKVIGIVMGKTKGSADGGRVSALVKEMLL